MKNPRDNGLLKRSKPYPTYRPSGVEWLGEIPQHWHLQPLWTMFRRSKRVGYEEGELLSVYRDYGVIPKSSRDDNFNRPSEDLSAYQFVQSSDLVINKMKAWQGSVAISEYSGIVSPAYHIYVGSHCNDDRYLHHLFRSGPYISAYQRISKGIRTNQWDLEPEAFSRIEVLLPPLGEQRAIAAFLDRETSKIDSLVAKKERLVDLLQEKRTALISRAVTKGLDPDVQLKDSGVEWLGEIPAHWEVRRLKSISEIRYGLGQPPRESPDGLPLIRATNVSNGHITDVGMVFIDPLDVPSGRRAFLSEHEIIVVRSGAYTADSSIVPRMYEGAVAGYDMVVTARSANPEFLATALLCPYVRDAQLVVASTRSAQPHLNAEELGEALILLPPLSEQQSIAVFLGSEIPKLDALIVKVREAIENLKEFRAALISAAVTGRIDVREEAA